MKHIEKNKFSIYDKRSEMIYVTVYIYQFLNRFKGERMIIGAGKINLKLHDVDSLKGKRKIIKSMITRIKNQFNISIAETDYNDSHLFAQIGFSITGNNARVVNSKLDKVFNMADDMGLAQITDTQMEIIHL